MEELVEESFMVEYTLREMEQVVGGVAELEGVDGVGGMQIEAA
jgi:hypothetical protein